MKRSLSMLFCMGAVLVWSGCTEPPNAIPEPNQVDQMAGPLAKKPTPSLAFSTYAYFLGGAPMWGGTATLEGGGTYGIRFFNLSGLPRDISQAKPFEEYWEIYDLANPATVYLAGTHSGVVSMPKSHALANGKVEVANPPFEMWLGRTTHGQVTVYWLSNGFPEHAEGYHRIN